MVTDGANNDFFLFDSNFLRIAMLRTLIKISGYFLEIMMWKEYIYNTSYYRLIYFLLAISFGLQASILHTTFLFLGAATKRSY